MVSPPVAVTKFQIAIVTGHIRQINWQIYPHFQVEVSNDHEWQFQIAIVTGHIGRSTGRSTPPPVEASSGQHWQFHIAIVKAHIGI